MTEKTLEALTDEEWDMIVGRTERMTVLGC
jgi:hypothetical protein